MDKKHGQSVGKNLISYNRYSDYSDVMKTTTIQLDVRVKDLLRSFGRKGDTYNDIIESLIERARYVEFMEESYRILDSKENWASLDDL